MGVHWWEIVGLIGMTLVLSVGRIFAPLRAWLLGFENPFNVLRLGGELLSCSMCCGVWVGFLWGFFVEGFAVSHALALGGVISISSLVVDEVVGVVALYRLKGRQRMGLPERGGKPLQRAPVRQGERPADLMRQARQQRSGMRGMTEEEADALADAREEANDSLVLGELPQR